MALLPFSFRTLRNSLGCGLLAVSCILMPAECAAEEFVQPPDSTASAQQLLHQLAGPAYRSRKLATRQLIEMGDSVLSAVRENLDHPDAEVRERCRRIADTIVATSRSRRTKRFVAGADDSGELLPGWEALRRRVGDTVEARRWLSSILKTDWELLESFEQASGDAAEIVMHEVSRLHQLRSSQRVQPTPENLAAVLLMANDAKVNLPQHSLSHALSLLHQLSRNSTQGIDPWKDDAFRKLAGGLIRQCVEPSIAYQSFTLALRHDLTDGLTPAIAILADESTAAHIRQYAILTIARFGNEQHVQPLESLFDDQSVCYRRVSKPTNNATQFECQVRDVALASVLHLLSKDPRQFGYAELKQNSYSVFQPHSLGFAADEQRQAARQKWEEFRRQSVAIYSETVEVTTDAAPQSLTQSQITQP